MKQIGFLCLLIGFVYSALNVQGLIAQFVSVPLSQQSAYLVVGLVVVGSAILLSYRDHFVIIINMWFVFFICYFLFGITADVNRANDTSYLKAIIPVLNYVGFAILLSINSYRAIFPKIAAVIYFIAAVIGTVFQLLNFSMDYQGISEYAIERAGGVYGDPNQSALVYVMAFLFLYYFVKPSSTFLALLRSFMLLITLYALLLTFSKTGFVVMIVVLAVTYHRYFSWKRLILTVFVLSTAFFLLTSTLLRGDLLSTVQKDRVQNIVNILTLNTDEVQLSDRDVLLKKMMNYVYDNPIIGNGISFSNDIRGHNTIIGVWADAGVITFLIFLAILFRYFKKSLSAPKSIRYFSTSLIFTFTVFMVSLQTIINQPYLLVTLIYLGYLIESEYNPEQI